MIEKIKIWFEELIDLKQMYKDNEIHKLFKRIEKQQELLKKLNTKIFNLENTLKDKDKIIKLLEKEGR